MKCASLKTQDKLSNKKVENIFEVQQNFQFYYFYYESKCTKFWKDKSWGLYSVSVNPLLNLYCRW